MEQFGDFGIKLDQNGCRLPIESDGYAGRLGSDKPVVMTVEVPSNIQGFMVDGKKNVVFKKKLYFSENDEKISMGLRVQIKTSNAPGVGVNARQVLHTEYPHNHMRFLKICDGGIVKVWEVALISQGGLFFTTIQETYSASCYRDGNGKVICPIFAYWPQMLLVLTDLFNGITLPEYKGEEIKDYIGDTSQFPLMTGVVQWFNIASGVGVVQTRDIPAKVHWSQIPGRPRLRYLKTGEKIKFRTFQPVNDTKAKFSSIANQVVGVEIIQ